jgi:Peptidase family M28
MISCRIHLVGRGYVAHLQNIDFPPAAQHGFSEETSQPADSAFGEAAGRFQEKELMIRVRSLWAVCCLGMLVSGPMRVVRAADDAPSARSESACPTPITVEEVRPHVEYLASPDLRGRKGEDALEAARYIRDAFREEGLQPAFKDDAYFQEIPGVLGDDPATRIIGRNVAGIVRGSDPQLRDEVVIVSAHYDHLGVRNGLTYAGADDNASGVAMLIEAAREVAALETKPRRSVCFVAFDLEEHLLWGSRWFVAHPPWKLEQVKLFITADMISRSLGDLPLPTVFVLGSEHAPRVRSMLEDVGTPEGLDVARLGADLIGTRSDYGPFRDQKVPFLFFSTGEHADYHTPRDTPDRVDYQKLARVSNLILALTRHVADCDETPVWVDEPATDLGEARTVFRIASFLIQAEENNEVDLTDRQMLFLSQVRNETGAIIDRGMLTRSERTSLARTAQLLLLSVF